MPWYITGMKTQLASGAALLLAVAALFAVEAATQSQKSARQPSGTASQEHKPPAEKASQGAATRKIACKTPENASLCYWTHGRLVVADGNPTLRMWKIGTQRVVGVYSGPSHFPPRTIADDESPELPPELENAYEADYRRWKRSDAQYYEFPRIFADVEICPLEEEKKGEMQPVCIESAKKIFVQKSY